MTTYRLDIEVNTEDAVPAHQTEGSGVLEGDVVDDARYLGTVPPQERDPSHNFTPCRYESNHFEVLVNVAANVVGYENATPADLDEAWEQVGIQHESEIARTEIREGDVIRFRPRARRNTVTVSVTHGFDGYGWILGYRAKIEGDVVISRGMEPLAYAVPETVELVRR